MNEVCSQIRKSIDALNLNDNIFFTAFRRRELSRDQLTFVCQQYYLYIRTFPQILAGLSHRVESEEVRAQLARTVLSELGDGHGLPHFKLFEKVMKAASITIEDYRRATYLPEATALVEGLKRMFLVEAPIAAIGGHYTIEETGLPMLEHLYEGFRHYPGWDVRSMEYFHLHLFLEADHVDWIEEAVAVYAADPQYQQELIAGGTEVARLLNAFWLALYRQTYGESQEFHAALALMAV